MAGILDFLFADQQAQAPSGLLGQDVWSERPPYDQNAARRASLGQGLLYAGAGLAGGQNWGEGLSKGLLGLGMGMNQGREAYMQDAAFNMEMQKHQQEQARQEALQGMYGNMLGVGQPSTQMAGPLAAGAPPVGMNPGGMPVGDTGADPMAQPQLAQLLGPQRYQIAQALFAAGDYDGLNKLIIDATKPDPERYGVTQGEYLDTDGDGKADAVQMIYKQDGTPAGPPKPLGADAASVSVEIGGPTIMNAGLEPTNAVTTDLQTTALSAQTQIDNLQGMLGLYEPEFLTYAGQLKAGAGDFLNKLDPENRNQMSQRFANFEQQSLQFFNAYRKWATGVAAGEKELGWLQDSIPSMQDSPQAFEAKIQTMIQRTRLVQIRAQMALRQGITPDGEGWREWAAQHPLEGIPTANERGAQLEAQGYSEDQVLELLRQEGY